MIPDYKFYHGAVIAELIDKALRPLLFSELHEDGRLGSYIIDREIGIHIKHSSSRMPPWLFTYTKSNLLEIRELQNRTKVVFLVLVCWEDGFVCLSLSEAVEIMAAGESEQVWIRAERKRGEWYSVSGSGGALGKKKPQGLGPVFEFTS